MNAPTKEMYGTILSVSVERVFKTVNIKYKTNTNNITQNTKLTKFKIRLFLCFSLFCVRVRVGFEPQTLQNKQKKIYIKDAFYGIFI
jgi:hypothetical protein